MALDTLRAQPNQNTFKVTFYNRDDIYLEKLIKQKFSASFMNNSKWVKLITALIENSSHIKECKVKPIWDDTESKRHLSLDKNTQFGFDFYDTAMEAMVSGEPTGWYAYKEIEWLDFPAVTNSINNNFPVQQDLQFIKSIIDKLGQYKLELTHDNLRLYAYLR